MSGGDRLGVVLLVAVLAFMDYLHWGASGRRAVRLDERQVELYELSREHRNSVGEYVEKVCR